MIKPERVFFAALNVNVNYDSSLPENPPLQDLNKEEEEFYLELGLNK